MSFGFTTIEDGNKPETSGNSDGMNLYQKLAKIRAISDVAQKDKKGFNYTYTDITQILAKVTAGMKKYSVSLVPCIVPGTAHVEQNIIENTKFTKTGQQYMQHTTEMIFWAEMVFRWVNDEDPDEFIDVPWFATASMSDASQALGASLTYTMRQFLTSYFQIAQSDNDVDAYRSKQREAEVAEDKAIAEGIINEFDKICKAFLADNPDDKDKVKKFLTKYVKDANYFKIKEPSLASKLLEDFVNTFKIENKKEEK